MLCRRLQDLTYCISYNVNFLNDKAHGAKQFRKRYTMLEELGRGGFGIVYKAERNEDSVPVAVKFIEHKRVREWTMKCKQLIPTEICLLDMCRSVPGVVQLIDWFANSKGFLIVMERPEQCLDLFDLISVYGYLDEDIARSIFVQILNTTCLLYNTYGIFHRDIKDENIIINMDTGEAILVDFGAAAFISEACVKEFQGTRSYCPPEWFKRLAFKPLEATVWSLGIVLYVMVSGCLPFQNEIQICLGRFTIPKHISKDCENLLRQCLAVTPSRRPELLEIFKHRWLNQPIVVHSEPFRVVLQRHFQKKKEAQGRYKLQQCGIQENSKKSSIPDESANRNEFITKKNAFTSCDISFDDNLSAILYANDHFSYAISLHNIYIIAISYQQCFQFQLVEKAPPPFKHKVPFSYDNVVMNIRTDMFALRDCYEDGNNVLIRPSSIAEESEYSDSPFCSAYESISMISTDPQNSESYVTALEDDSVVMKVCNIVCHCASIFRECFFQRSKEATAIEHFNNSFRDNSNANNHRKEEVVQANCPDRPMENIYPQKVMNSRLVAKHWLPNVATRSKYGSLKLQKPSICQKKEELQKEANVSNNLLRIFNIDSRRSSNPSITTIVPE
uniref:Serine/threonine-protein kinase 1 n=1 Tax=Wuchereria bancrofti TaxID=6293 RepID=A0A1I8EWB9_WUCBA